jgi:hypothetical protein
MKLRLSSFVGWTCVILVAAFNIFAGIMKFVPIVPGSEGAAFMEKLGTAGLEHTLGVLELTIVLLYLIPRTSTIGFILLIGYLSGALATNLTHGLTNMDALPIYILFVVMMIGAWIRNPELTARLRGKSI